jgi:phospholipase/carboxylesterase
MGLEYIEHCVGDLPVGTVIWLHGLGADGHDFEPIVPELGLPEDLPLRFIFPHASVRPVTINGGLAMRAWYDIDPRQPLAGTGDIRESAAAVAALAEAEGARNVPPSRIVLAGFSQGGVIALQLGLRYRAPLAGIMALSTYVHAHERLVDEISLENAETPIFMAHGVQDPMIPITRAITSREALRALNYTVEWHEYPMGHGVCQDEIRDIGAWLQRIFTIRG